MLAVSILKVIQGGEKELMHWQGEDKKWKMRDGGGETEDGEIKDEEKKERGLGLEEDASKNTLAAAKTQEEADVDMEMDDLADRLFDAKVGVNDNDHAVNDLMAGLSRL
jgi:hypothetical protein